MTRWMSSLGTPMPMPMVSESLFQLALPCPSRREEKRMKQDGRFEYNVTHTPLYALCVYSIVLTRSTFSPSPPLVSPRCNQQYF